MKTLKCEFTPQVWIGDNAMTVDPQGDTIFTVDWPDDEPIPRDNDYGSDHLRLCEGSHAPAWIQDYSGPFEIQVINREEFTP